MGNLLLASIDPGKGNTKYSYFKDGEIQTGIFKTRGRLIKDNENVENSTDYIVSFNGEKWGIGEGYDTKINKNNTHSKSEGIHIAAIYAACSNIIKDLEAENTDVKFVLAVTNPLDSASNTNITKELADKLKGKKEIIFNKDKYNFSIEKVAIIGESAGSVYYNASHFKDRNVLMVDLGDYNLNACSIEDMKLKNDSFVTEVWGMQKLHSMLTDALKLNDFVKSPSVATKKLNDTLDNDIFSKSGESIEQSVKFIKEVKEEFLNGAETIIRDKHNIEDYDSIAFIGATSTVLREQIKNKYKNAVIFDNSQNVNCIGNLKWLKTVVNC